MSVRVPGTGPLPCEILLVGERPTEDEIRLADPEPFHGTAEGLWRLLAEHTGLTRDTVYRTYLVKTYAARVITDEEVARDRLVFMQELQRCQPTLMITVGVWTARALLTHDQSRQDRDRVFGVAFPYSYGKLTKKTCWLVPIAMPVAAFARRYASGHELLQCERDIEKLSAVLKGTTQAKTLKTLGLGG